ncbi:class II aldolase/adducin family protein [Cohnella cellulosilytica]|uniref:Class II aldolase/adducin family protein n=1 Tax=Cohnella cellulosilytica TaxID=986710 RepID=A0ABW2FEP8_9BACL
MRYEFLHPADQILLMMDRIYGYGMTTTSGGNLSILDENNQIWITPAGVDKGALTRNDIVCVKPDGSVVGPHRPSSEFPFHRLIYDARPDLRAVVHAHPPALVSFSIVRRIPDTRLLPNERQICGEIGMAEYALPGSRELGENIAAVFKRGIDSVMLENHGVVVGGTDLFKAFQRFETLDFCARLEINARRIGNPALLSDEQFRTVADGDEPAPGAFVPGAYGTEELAIRRDMCALIKRAYDQRLFTSTQGTFSHRLADGAFVITPYGADRKYLEPEDLVRIEGEAAEAGKTPSRSVRLHRRVYELHPHIDSVIIAHPPNAMAFAVTDRALDSRTIPESYILMRRTPKLPFDAVYRDTEGTAACFTKDTPIALVENNCVIVTGQNLLNAFDRLEVAEYSAKALLSAGCLGEIAHIGPAQIRELEVAFKL